MGKFSPNASWSADTPLKPPAKRAGSNGGYDHILEPTNPSANARVTPDTSKWSANKAKAKPSLKVKRVFPVD